MFPKIEFIILYGSSLGLYHLDDSDIDICIYLEEEKKNGTWINRHQYKLDRSAIREFLRVTKPKGRIVLTLDYANESISKRSFYFDYVKELIEELNKL